MKQSQARVEDSRLEAERRRTFRGSARISLDALHFVQRKHRDLDAKHVEYLKGCFLKDRYRRLEVQNHIEAEVDQHILDVALRDSNVTARELLTNQPNGCPELIFPQGFQLECLHGQHRVQAAREFLLPTDKWWTVDLYTSDINEDLKTCLNEQHSNEDRPTDGEAYCKIRNYHFQRNTKAELRWKACLRGCRLKNLKGLLLDEKFTAGFNALLDIPGVWDGMRLTTLQKMIAMGCRDECLNYLRLIKEVLTGLVGKDALGRIDTATVKALEGRAPGASTKDFRELQGGKIFSAFSDRERDMIYERLKRIDGLVLSLFTFFRDIQYLKLCVDCLKRLVIVPKRESVCETLARTYSNKNQRDGHVKIQITEDSFLDRAGTPADCIDLGIRQLVALAMRKYPAMVADHVKEDPVQIALTKADPAVLRSLADLAHELGFDSHEIRALKEHPSRSTARLDSPPPPLHVTSGCGIAVPARSGIPRTKSYEEDRDCLFITDLHSEQQHRGEGITSFFVRKSVYLAFFSRPMSTSGGNDSSVRGESSPCSPERPGSNNASGSPGHMEDDIEGILSTYAQRGENDGPQSPSDTEGTDDALDRSGEREEEREEREREERTRREQANLAQAEAERGQVQARLEKERLARDKFEEERRKLEEHRLEEERRRLQRLGEQRLAEEKLEEQRQEAERRRLEEQRQEEERKRLESQRSAQETICINFLIRERSTWRRLSPIQVNPAEPSEITRIAKKYMWKGIRTFNTRLRLLPPQDCFQAVFDDRTHTVLLIPNDFGIDEEIVDSARKLHADARKRVLGLKRIATDDISQFHHLQKIQALNP
ncbi:uncharacterized protein RSE6_00835 [Rhynchosporium secalis]|uniref:Uncharacterized protein n=1 Tax=Rhynchosporium secalis TaxID=38038 RepID=A0A1E1LWC3_RHYSE|nr:uncharacterized protein RSE6_00835 [Rhynchosporium secalis]